jgi:hypothetical protein
MLLAIQHFLISTYTYLEITINNLHPTDQYITQQIHEKRTDRSKKITQQQQYIHGFSSHVIGTPNN